MIFFFSEIAPRSAVDGRKRLRRCLKRGPYFLRPCTLKLAFGRNSHKTTANGVENFNSAQGEISYHVLYAD